jgi:hypothetical protein
MAQPPSAPAATEDAFIADRQQFWNGFTSFVIASGTVAAATLILMALFLL